MLLNARAPMNVEWSYKIATQPSYYLDCFVVKLHKKSNYRFRLEYLKGKSEIDEMLGILVENSVDPLFLGYPYGLILADKRARISNDEISHYKIKLESQMKNYKEIQEYFTTVNAHDTLDRFN
jgi:hypothetical protein